MGIESATYIADLTPSTPGSSDLIQQGDDHLRLLKSVLQNSFPGLSKAFYTPSVASKSSNFSVLSSDANKTFLISTTGGGVTMALPALTSDDAGWECFLLKTTFDVNPILVTPPSGTLSSGAISGLAAARRCIPSVKVSCYWTGTSFIVSRATSAGPVGSCIEYHGATLPYGFEWPNGQTLSSASTNYPEYNAVIGSGVTLDKRGRNGVALDNLGGSAAGRLAGGIITGTTIGNTGGTDTVSLSTAQLASHSHTGTTGSESADHTHTYTQPLYTGGQTPGGSFPSDYSIQQNNTGGRSAAHTHSFTSNNAGSGSAHSNLPPSIMVAELLVTE